MTKKEALKICKSIKKLYQFDKKNGISNFTNKWPSKENRSIFYNEKEYLRILKKYLNITTDDNSLLNIPLLCRYAYQIICDWYVSGQDSYNQTYNTQSDKVKKVIECCIKWEFHDRYTYQTEGGTGNDILDKYRDQIWNFLTDIAGIMGDKKFIEKDRWMQAKSLREIQDINEAYCVLQEVKNKDEKEKLCFIHNTFQNYFLARYYILMTREEREKKEDQFKYLLKTNSEFATMFIEQLINGTDELSKEICIYILQLENTDIDKLVEYARGNLRYIYESNMPFTIEEYLSIFPNGSFEYNGIVFNRDVMNELCLNGILEINNVNFLKDFDKKLISNNDYLTGMQINNNYDIDITIEFDVYLEGVYEPIAGKDKHLDKDTLFRIVHKFGYDDSILKNQAAMQLISKRVSDYVFEKNLNDHFKIRDIAMRVANIIGLDKKYWCVLDENNSLFVYQMISANEEKMTLLFSKGREISYDYIVLYGKYKSLTLNKGVNKEFFQRIDKISFVFDSNCSLQIENEKHNLYTYYNIHSNNLSLIKFKTDGKNIDLYMQLVCDIISAYAEVDKILEETTNEKLKLYFSDEKLLTFYAIGEGEKMVKLAKDTLELCNKYNHLKGIEFRKFLLDDNTCFNGSDLEKVYLYAKNYIWM